LLEGAFKSQAAECSTSAPKVMPAILLCWPIMSEVYAGHMTVEVEPSQWYFITFCNQVTDCSRGAAWQNGIWHGSACKLERCHWIPPCGKKNAPTDIHWCLLNVHEDHTVDVSTVRWWMARFSSRDWQWVTSAAAADFYQCDTWIHEWWKYIVMVIMLRTSIF